MSPAVPPQTPQNPTDPRGSLQGEGWGKPSSGVGGAQPAGSSPPSLPWGRRPTGGVPGGAGERWPSIEEGRLEGFPPGWLSVDECRRGKRISRLSLTSGKHKNECNWMEVGSVPALRLGATVQSPLYVLNRSTAIDKNEGHPRRGKTEFDGQWCVVRNLLAICFNPRATDAEGRGRERPRVALGGPHATGEAIGQRSLQELQVTGTGQHEESGWGYRLGVDEPPFTHLWRKRTREMPLVGPSFC